MSDLLLQVEGLDAFYGSAQVLHGVTFEMGREPVSIIGRNGMGKSTLCAALMGLSHPRTSGSIMLESHELLGQPPHRISSRGIGYVPQGRRLFPSLTVEEHLHIVPRRSSGRWGIERIFDLFPRLAERRRNGGAQLSGGEQQMLAIARALLTNPKLIVMDEPSEGLAPAVIDSLTDTLKTLVAEGLGLLLIEQNLGVATSVADRQLVMVGGQIVAETTASEILADQDAQRRFLGVEPLSHDR